MRSGAAIKIVGGVSATTPPASPAGAATLDPGFTYQCGPIIAQPQLYASFWGSSWTDVNHKQRRADLIQFLQDILASDYVNILSQYGVGEGAGKCGAWKGDSNLETVTGQMTDSDIHSSIQRLIDGGTLPEPEAPSSTALMIFLDESIEIKDSIAVICEPSGDTAFGYHSFYTTNAGHQVYYGVVPALDDNCLRNTCSQDSSCSLHLAQTQEQRQTQVASHEFCEMTTDPEIDAWRDPANRNENGDICNGLSGTITVNGRAWTVQRMYSRTDDVNGLQACVLAPPNPIPPLIDRWVGSWAELYSDNDLLRTLRVGQNLDGRLEVFGLSGGDHIWHTWQTQPNGGWVGSWAELYSDNDRLAMLDVGRNLDGRLEVFGVSGQNHIWHTWQTQPNGGWVGSWAELYSDSGQLRTLRVGQNQDGRLEVFGLSGGGHIWHTWQTQPNGGWVGSWAELYSDNDQLVMLDVGRNLDGRLEVFGVSGQNHIWHTWQTRPNGGWMGSWAELYSDNDQLRTLRVGQNQDGRLEVFGLSGGGRIWHTWQTQPSGGWVGSWAELYSDNDQLVMLDVGRNPDGRLEVFGVSGQNHIWHTWQTQPNGGLVGCWAELYSDNDQLAMLDVGSNLDGRLEVFGMSGQSHIWHTWQT